MKILHIITTLENGGAQEVLKTVCSGTRLTHDHKIFYLKGDNAYKKTDSILALALPLDVHGFPSVIRSVFSVSRFVKSTNSPVCIQGWLYQSNLLAFLIKLVSPRTPVIFSIHNGSDRWEFVSWSGYLASRVCCFFSGMAKATIFVSANSLASHVSYKNSIVIPNPIKLKISQDNERVLDLEVLASEITLACVARFDPIKNIGFLLDIVQELRARGVRIKLLMAGEGTSATNIQLVNMLRGRNLEDNVEMLGVVSDIASVYLRADFTVLTSKCESFSNVLLESIASGTPFISSNVGIAEDLLSPDSLVIKGFELPDWVKAMEQKLQARKTHEVSANVRAFYQKVSDIYAPERIAALYSDCWSKALGR